LILFFELLIFGFCIREGIGRFPIAEFLLRFNVSKTTACKSREKKKGQMRRQTKAKKTSKENKQKDEITYH
jgi:hypothetical protein